MAKLTKLEADQLMEKFSKLTLSKWENDGRDSQTLFWKAGNQLMALNMYYVDEWRLATWNRVSGTDDSPISTFNYELSGTLGFGAFSWWQKIRLRRFFTKIRNEFVTASDKVWQQQQYARNAAALKAMVGTASE